MKDELDLKPLIDANNTDIYNNRSPTVKSRDESQNNPKIINRN